MALAIKLCCVEHLPKKFLN